MPDVTSTIDLYDHEFVDIERVVAKLNAAKGQRRDMEGFRREVVERFQEIGLVVEVKAWYTQTTGTYAFDIEFVGRTEDHTFDHERQSYEVRHDILGIDQPMEIGPNGEVREPMKRDIH